MGNEAAAVAEPVASAAQPQPGAAPEWHTHLTDELKADPVVSDWVKKASEKDIPAIIKGYAHSTKRMGSAINLPGKDAKPEEVTALQAKLREAGIIPTPPATPADYKITKPEKLAEGIGWNDGLATKLSTVLHKHGAPAALAADLLALHEENILGMQKSFQTSMDTGTAALKQEFGDKYDERKELAGRLLPAIFKTPEDLALAEDLGLANHPGFMGLLMRLAPLAAQDSSFMASAAREGGQMTGDAVRAEVADIMSNKDNPKHALYWKKDKATLAYIDELYAKAYGNKKVELGGLSLSSDTPRGQA